MQITWLTYNPGSTLDFALENHTLLDAFALDFGGAIDVAMSLVTFVIIHQGLKPKFVVGCFYRSTT